MILNDLLEQKGGAIVIGNAGRDVESRVTKNGKTVHSVSVGVYAGKDQTTWVKLVDFNDLLANVRKGDKVAAFGALKLAEFSKRDGSQGFSLELIVSELANRSKGQGKPQGNPNPSDIDDADLPF